MLRPLSPTSLFPAVPRYEYQRISEQTISDGSNVNAIAISLDTKLIAVGSTNRHIWVYNHTEALIDIHHCEAQACAIQWNAPYQSMVMLFAGMDDGRIVWIYDINVRIFPVMRRHGTTLPKHSGAFQEEASRFIEFPVFENASVEAISLSPSSTKLATAGANTVKPLDLHNGKIAHSLWCSRLIQDPGKWVYTHSLSMPEDPHPMIDVGIDWAAEDILIVANAHQGIV